MFPEFCDMRLTVIKENSKNLYLDVYKDCVKVYASCYYSDTAIYDFICASKPSIDFWQKKLNSEEVRQKRKRIIAHSSYRKIDSTFEYAISDNISSNDIYKISMTQFIDLYGKDETFRKEISSGAYIYVDGYVCVDNQKYIERDCDKVFLTDYGIKHKDECCISFFTGYVSDKEEKTFGSVPELVSTSISSAVKACEKEIMLDDFIRNKRKELRLSQESLAENSMVNFACVSNIEKRKVDRTALKNLYGLASGLKLSIQEVQELTELDGYFLRNAIPTEMAYKACWSFCTAVPLRVINACLVKLGFEPWGAKEYNEY